jgi:hypothetical protein
MVSPDPVRGAAPRTAAAYCRHIWLLRFDTPPTRADPPTFTRRGCHRHVVDVNRLPHTPKWLHF